MFENWKAARAAKRAKKDFKREVEAYNMYLKLNHQRKAGTNGITGKLDELRRRTGFVK